MKTYAVINKNEEVRKLSRSGGIFTALSDEILNRGGVIYGCVLDENFSAKHIRATTFKERDLMRGSKYIQSIIGDSFKQAKVDLDNGLDVLFSGTSCQIAGLKNYLRKDYDNLVCLDILCHGVPSPAVWKKYLEWVSNRLKSKIISANFRNKLEYGWRAHYETITGLNGKQFHGRVFFHIAYVENFVRPSCYECKYADIRHPADITIGDYWGIEKAYPAFDDNKGVSLVLINTTKGQAIFDSVKDNIFYSETKIEDSLQPVLKGPFSRPENRDKFWNDFSKYPFTLIAYKYGEYGVINKYKKRIGYKINALSNRVFGVKK
ncbi:Coenzyme F420 hydrogenase/dehydrogenase, beta subunit C-terminal domain [Butyrivibrio sp. WCD2001]|uniref:Coenzyme F420 hydrogenase/dehydrogenase, beta subunit C-terminal domain n=1 Tax=Butyrivibrio sp. WCD2001 TaxID=1280681 RepID=UPI0005D226B6|nr:Coenzyme F420 hydrogenase/dehydrogenase, beta subunit C-terminal domain [Butyrivibrio sp. WCD2001]